jgi:hypothetical protein
MDPHITTRSGGVFYPGNPRAEDVRLGDIAHALSQIGRFTGHTSEFYSVAQHCVLVSYLCPSEYALWGLLHDAAEAYIGDVSSPLKSLLPDYREIEHRVEQCVWGVFGLTGTLPPAVKAADVKAYELERDALMLGIGMERAVNFAMPPLLARYAFKRRFYQLTQPAAVAA